MQYCLYLRKSRSDMEAEAHGEGETLARHEKILLDLARRKNYNVTQIYREVVSGETIAARPVMQHLLSEVGQGLWSGVLVMEIERLARGDTVDQGLIAHSFKFSDTKIITPLKVYDPNDEYDEEYFEFGLFMSRREYKTINRRLQRGKVASSEEGKWVSNRVPYGYRRIKLEKEKGWVLEPVEEEAAIVRMMFELYTNGLRESDGSLKQMSLRGISRYLDDLGVPSPTGGLWRQDVIAKMIENPVYIGKIRWGRTRQKKKVIDGNVVKVHSPVPENEVKIYEGRHPAIVSEELFALANEARKKSWHPSPRIGVPLKTPLAGLVYCSKCGRAMIRQRCDNRPVYGSLTCITHGCDTISSNLSLVEERILSGLSEWLTGYELDWESVSSSFASGVEMKRKILSSAEAELKKLYLQQDRAHDLLEQGVYDTETFLSRSRLLSEKIESTKANIERFSQELLEAEEIVKRQRDVIPKVKKLLDVYASLSTPLEKNMLLKEVVEKVVYKKELIDGKRPKPDGFELEIYPRIPKKTE